MFIGQDLNEQQVAALQLVADVSAGCPFARLESLRKEAENMTYLALHDEYGNVQATRLDVLFDELKKECLVERKEDQTRGPLVGLTSDGKRCNRISYDFE